MDQSSGQLPSGTVTFLFSDIEGSTRLTQELDPPNYRELVDLHHRLLRAAFSAHGGAERGTQGDSFLVVFRDAPSAVAAAVDAQRSIAAAIWPGGREVRVRMGLHTGEGIRGGDDYIGLDINRAARIASAAHGGQVLISEATRALSDRTFPPGVGLIDVGEHRLKDLDLPERLYQLTIAGLSAEFPPVRTLDVGSAHLPLRVTSFVGRRADLDDLHRLIREHRLITLVGPGGTGKTSLATEFAREAAGQFTDGAWFVDLAPLTDPALVAPTLARSLGLKEQPDRPIEELLTAHLNRRELLLVLDNFEHVLAATGIVEDLVAAGPGLKVVVTSRIPLNLYGEQEFVVSSLTLPDRGVSVNLEQLTSYEAVALFLERARAARPAFSITEESAPVVAEICIRLDGLPLAIELAASRIRILEPKEILTRLEQRLPVLIAGANNLPARHRTLQGAIEWSYELLQPVEQTLFARLAIFAGGCTLEAAEAICNPGRELRLDTFDGIASLVNQSIVRQRGVAGESRFEMLETIRDFGLDRLEAGGSLEEMGRRHLGYYQYLVETAEPHFLSVDQAQWLDRIQREHFNLRGALKNALDMGLADSGLQLAAGLWRFWLQRGYLREGRSWLEVLLALEPDTVSAAQAKGYTALGGLTYWLSDADATERAYESAVRLYRQIGDLEAEAEALYNLAFVPAMRNDPEAAHRGFQASLALAREIGHPNLVARNQISLGTAALTAGDLQAALKYFDEALIFFRETGDRFHTAWAIGSIGQVHSLLGQLQEGRMAFLEALRLFTEDQHLPGIGAVLEEISTLESSAGRHIEAMRLVGAAAALREMTGASAPLRSVMRLDAEEAARQAIGDEAVAKALAEGRRMSLEDAVEYAAGILTDR